MGENSKIEWTHHTFNPWRGCTKVSPGCKHCYAETLSARNPAVLGVWGDAGTRVVASEAMWRQPLAWNRAAAAAGERHRVFCASLADVFEDRPELVEPRARLFKLIVATPHLDWLLLTKRPENASKLWAMAHAHARPWSNETPAWARNVWLGASVENQAAADERIPLLLQVPAAVRFLSCEPLLGSVDLGMHLRRGKDIHMALDVAGALHNGSFDGFTDHGKPVPRAAVKAELQRLHEAGVKLMPMGECEGFSPETGCPGHPSPGLDWVIVGGESGPGARSCDVAWIRSIVAQCREAQVPVFVKQLGAVPVNPHYPIVYVSDAGVMNLRDRKGGDPAEWPADLQVREFPAPRAEVPHAT